MSVHPGQKPGFAFPFPTSFPNDSQAQPYSWNGVIDFLQQQLQGSQMRENEWQLDKKRMQVFSKFFLTVHKLILPGAT